MQEILRSSDFAQKIIKITVKLEDGKADAVINPSYQTNRKMLS
jgi:hypothetical protein